MFWVRDDGMYEEVNKTPSSGHFYFSLFLYISWLYTPNRGSSFSVDRMVPTNIAETLCPVRIHTGLLRESPLEGTKGEEEGKSRNKVSMYKPSELSTVSHPQSCTESSHCCFSRRQALVLRCALALIMHATCFIIFPGATPNFNHLQIIWELCP